MICSGKVALVTGAAGKGMGRSIALTLAREGAKTVVNYRTNAEEAAAIVESIKDKGGDAIALQADVMTAEGCEKLVRDTIAAYGQIDICIINPGGDWRPGPIQDISASNSIEDVSNEVAPLFLLTPLILPGMYKRKWGRVIGLSMDTSEAITPGHGYSYCVGKAARTAAMRMMKEQAWGNSVTVNLIAPGPVQSIDTLDEAAEQCEHGPAWMNRTTTTAQDIAEGVAFLCSESANYITGTEVRYTWRG